MKLLVCAGLVVGALLFALSPPQGSGSTAPAAPTVGCVSCPREGQPGLPPQVVVGWKVWTVTPRNTIEKISGRTFAEWQVKVPDDGVLVVMLYYNRFSTTGEERYRRIEEGSDAYFVAPSVDGVVYGHNNDAPDAIRRRYPGASIKLGKWADEATFKRAVSDAMADYSVSDIGLSVVPRTTDK